MVVVGRCETIFNGRQGLSVLYVCEVRLSARSVLMDDMLNSTVLRSGFVDGFCVVLFEVDVVSSVGEFGSPPVFGEDHEGGLPCECSGFVILPYRSFGL